MEKGSFQSINTIKNNISENEFQDLDFIEVEQVPLPNEVPVAPSMETLKGKNKSGAVDALILQNEDLMSRLSVHIRRCSILEDQVSEQDLGKEKYLKQIESLRDQLLILKQKDQFISNRNNKSEKEHLALKDKLEFLETKYTEYYTKTQQTIDSLNAELKSTKITLCAFRKYRSKLMPFAKEKRELSDNQAQQIEGLEHNIKLVQIQLGQAGERLQDLNKEHSEDIKTLNTEFADSKAELLKRVSELDNRNIELENKTKDYHDIYEKNIFLKNRVVELERVNSEISGQFESEVHELQTQTASFRADLKSKVLELQSIKGQLEIEKSTLAQAEGQNKKLVDQIESIQLVWSETQKENEKLKEQNISLQKLNQTLSTKLNENRIEISNLKADLDQSIFSSREHIEKLKKGHEVALKENKTPEAEESLQLSNDVLDKIESLICEIQTGFEKTSLDE